MLKELIQDGYGIKEDLNCAETILYGANRVYHLNLNSESLKLAAAFGGGMAIESVCGVLTASLMVLGKLFVPEVAHKYPAIKELSKELFLSLIHISEPTRLGMISYAVFCLKKTKK